MQETNFGLMHSLVVRIQYNFWPNFGSALANFNLTPRYPHIYIMFFISHTLFNAPINRGECFKIKMDNFLPKLKVYKTRHFSVLHTPLLQATNHVATI